MTSGKGLGKGLSALIEVEEEPLVRGIRLRDIDPNPNQPRREFDPVALSELEESIRQNGVITPITVRRAGERYVIIAGERRWRAARAAGLNEIPAYVLDTDEDESFRLALVENLQRQDLNPIEEAMGYRKLISDLGLSQEAVSEKVGRSRPYITNSLRLLTLPEPVREMLASGALTAGHGRALAALDEKKANEAAKAVIEGDLSVRETEKLVKRLLEGKDKQEPKKDDTLLDVRLCDGERDLLFVTLAGMSIRFPLSSVPVQGRIAAGVRGMTVDADDQVAWVLQPGESDDLVLFSERGWGKRVPQIDFEPQNRGGKGVHCFSFNKNGNNGRRLAGVAAVPRDSGAALLIPQVHSPLTRLSASEVLLQNKQGRGMPYVMAVLDDLVTGLSVMEDPVSEG